MAPSISYLSTFWKEIFEKEKLARRMAEVAALKEEGLIISPPINGCKMVKAWPASAMGDNFASDAYGVKAVLENGTELEAFIKAMPHNNFSFLMTKSLKLPQREIEIYDKLLQSLLVKVRSEAGVTAKEVPLNVPVMYYGHWDDVEPVGSNLTVVVLQDLKSLGFRMVDKRVGCTVKEAKLTLSAMAHYHALTLALMAKCRNPDGTFTLPDDIQFIPQTPSFHEQIMQMLQGYVPHFVKMMKSKGHEEAAVWLEKEHKNRAEKALSPQQIAECGRLVCILHADCWNNNMMYRHDENGKPVEMKMIDWQITRLGHPGTDVSHFLFTSTSAEIRRGHRHELLNHYFDILSSSMEKLGLPKYDRDLFLLEVRDRFRFGFFMALIVMTATLDTTGVEAMEEKDAKQEGKKETEFKPDEMVNEFQNMIDFEKILANNSLLCQRVIDLVEEVKEALQPRYSRFK